ncbi:MAG: molybdopterin-dependent oxidoreductase [Alphaproteobacteria bacterium]|nr:molybdopterin-dependent oxidoreductase [Alphaproteobacteria bacterium]
MFKTRSLVCVMTHTIAAMFLAIGVARAEALPQPKDRPLLEVTGQITTKNVGDKAAFDFAMLEALGSTTLVTSTAWTEGRPEFEGVLLSALIERIGATGSTAVAIALNDYKVEIPIEDFTRYPVILAYRMNGKRLRVRDKGPLWIIYPQDDFPALKTKQTQARWVWQVKEIQFK